jgi:hypothetical protein
MVGMQGGVFMKEAALGQPLFQYSSSLKKKSSLLG